MLNGIVSGYFDFAEVQAMRHNPMYMSDYLHDGFRLNFCDGINVLIGENGVGKTTILKMIYAATQWSIRQTDQGKTKRLMQFFSNSLNDSDALKNADNREGYCYYIVSDGTHSFEEWDFG